MNINFTDDHLTYNEYTLESFALIPLSYTVVNDVCPIAESIPPILDNSITSLIIQNDKCLLSEHYIYTDSLIDEVDLRTQIAKTNDKTIDDSPTINNNITVKQPTTLSATPLDDKDFIIDMSVSVTASGKSVLLNLLMNKKVGQIAQDVIISARFSASFTDDNFIENIISDIYGIARNKHQAKNFVFAPLSSLNSLHAHMVKSNPHIIDGDTTSLLTPVNKCYTYEEYMDTLSSSEEKEDCKEYAHTIPNVIENEDWYITGTICKSSIFILIALSYKSGPSLLLDTKSNIQALLAYTAVSALDFKLNNFNIKDLITDIPDFIKDVPASLISSGKSAFLGLLMYKVTAPVVQNSIENTPLNQVITKSAAQVVTSMVSVIPYTYVVNIESSIKSLYSQSDKTSKEIDISRPQEGNLVADALYAGGGEINRIIAKQLLGPYNHVVYALFSTALKEARELYEGSDITVKDCSYLFIKVFVEKKTSQFAKSFTDRNDIYTLSFIEAQSKVVSKKVMSSLT